MLDTIDPMVHQWLVFFVMVGVLSVGAWFVTPYKEKNPKVRINPVGSEKKAKELGYHFTLSSHYRHYRNPMRNLRRYIGWPSGRQWVKLRKYWNRETPNGAKRFAHFISTAGATSWE